MSTTKTILLVGGGLVGAVVLYKVLSPTAAAVRRPAGSPSLVGNQSSFVGLANSLVGLFSGSGGKQSSVTGQSGGSFATPSFNGQPGYIFAGADKSIDPSTGGVRLPDGASYGPPAPTTVADSSSFDSSGADAESFV